MSEAEIKSALKKVEGWTYEKGVITRTFTFKNYRETASFVNGVVFIANTEDHHPEVTFSYKNCKVNYNTHAIKGISENDFICAAKINELSQI